MREENLLIRLYRDRAKVEVDYVLHNSGEAVDVKAGFPSFGFVIEDENHREIEDYAILANGQRVSHGRERGDATPYKFLYRDEFFDMVPGAADEADSCMFLEWLVSTVHFRAKETKRIHISYESIYAYSDGGVSLDTDFNEDRFRYLLSTGAAWKGPIQEGRVTIRGVTADLAKVIISPTGRFRKTAEGLVWTFRDLEPSLQDNIEINFSNRFSQIHDYANESSEPEDDRYYVAQGGKYYLDSHDYAVRAGADSSEYPAANVRDYDSETAWRALKSPGLGESIVLEIKPSVHINQLGVVPGCGADKRAWFGHARVKDVDVLVNGEYTTRAQLPDEYISFPPGSIKGYQVVDLPAYPGDARTVQLTIRSVYPGVKDQVTCISEILLRQRLPAKPEKRGVDGNELP